VDDEADREAAEGDRQRNATDNTTYRLPLAIQLNEPQPAACFPWSQRPLNTSPALVVITPLPCFRSPSHSPSYLMLINEAELRRR
jgi:hypothetical protein